MSRVLKWTIGFLVACLILVKAEERSDLQKIRREIEQLEMDLKSKEVSEKTLIEQMEDINREIELRSQLLLGLEIQKRKKEKEILNTQSDLDRTNRSHQKLKHLVATRLISIYKHGQTADWEVLFTMSSFNQVLVWVKYQKIIMQNDRRNLRLLEEKEREVRIYKRQMENELSEKERLIEEKTSENAKLQEKKTEKRKFFEKERHNKELILEQLREIRLTYKEIKDRISIEEARRRVSLELVEKTQFDGLKGKLIWPVRGRVVLKYGHQKHPILKTTTENLGIDIETLDRASVQAVQKGIVKWITWQRGIGNLVLLDHGEGYYTVYGRLDEVSIQNGDFVDVGKEIGRVGDRLSLFGPTLHFEVWKGTTHFDPEKWLR